MLPRFQDADNNVLSHYVSHCARFVATINDYTTTKHKLPSVHVPMPEAPDQTDITPVTASIFLSPLVFDVTQDKFPDPLCSLADTLMPNADTQYKSIRQIVDGH